MRDSDECNPLHIKWGDRTHQGGDAWLGDCAEFAGIHVEMEYGFYPQPPVAELFHLYVDAVAFHGVEDHKAFHEARLAHAVHSAAHGGAISAAMLRNRTDPRCHVPIKPCHDRTLHSSPTALRAANRAAVAASSLEPPAPNTAFLSQNNLP